MNIFQPSDSARPLLISGWREEGSIASDINKRHRFSLLPQPEPKSVGFLSTNQVSSCCECVHRQEKPKPVKLGAIELGTSNKRLCDRPRSAAGKINSISANSFRQIIRRSFHHRDRIFVNHPRRPQNPNTTNRH